MRPISSLDILPSLMDGGELICYAEKKPKKVLFNSNPVSFSYSDNLLKVPGTDYKKAL